MDNPQLWRGKMNSSKTKSVLFIGVLILLFVSSCSFIPKGVKNLFATKTPTVTPTPTNTPTPTSTPLPPITLYQCAFNDECPEAIHISTFINGSVDYGSTFDLKIPYDQPLLITASWVAKNQQLLRNDLEHIKWFFLIDGRSYFNENWPEAGHITYDFDPDTVYPGEWIGVETTGWKIGEPHTIHIGFIADDTLYDGWDYYDPGTYVIVYNLTPANLPTSTPTVTATPTSTATFTPTNTNTPKPKPTAIPYTKTPKPTLAPTNPPCEINARIDISNTTGGTVTLDLNGPMKFHFNIAPGDTSLNVCSGSYTYIAWGCGGDTDTGSINSGEAKKFYCE